MNIYDLLRIESDDRPEVQSLLHTGGADSSSAASPDSYARFIFSNKVWYRGSRRMFS